MSITATKRRRFLWAAWWTAPPEAEPFRKPDASSGGARSRAEAHTAAERAAGRSLVETGSTWAAAWARILLGKAPWPAPRAAQGPRRVAPEPRAGSKPWARGVLALEKEASVAEVKRAFRSAALRTHPDHGGSESAFIEAKRAYDIALAEAALGARPKRAAPGRGVRARARQR